MLNDYRLEKMAERHNIDSILTEEELERLADFYHERGFYEEAIRTLEELLSIQHERECAAVRYIRRAS
ncbi:MAG TPA: hypothetical protein V6C76_03590 [Drouetiella sp.]